MDKIRELLLQRGNELMNISCGSQLINNSCPIELLLKTNFPSNNPKTIHLQTNCEGSIERNKYSPKSLFELEKEHVADTLIYTNWHKGRTCEILGISRPRLDRKIKLFQINQQVYSKE